MKNKKDPFKTDKPLYDYSITYDISHLSKPLKKIIFELEGFDKIGDWVSYDLKFDELEIAAKSYFRNHKISEVDYKFILRKYGCLYD